MFMQHQSVTTRSLLEYMQLRDCVTVPALARHLGVPGSTVVGVLSRLSDSGLLSRAGSLAGKRGRPVVSYRLRLPAAAAACQIEGTQLSAGIFDSELKCLAHDSIDLSAPPSPQEARQRLERLVAGLLSRCRMKPRDLFTAALGVNAVAIDGRTLASTVLPWAGEELASRFVRLAGVPVQLSILPAIVSQYRKLPDPPPSSACYLRAGDGVSAHLIEHGQILQGRHGLAGELGHVTFDPAGPLCGCGRRGCLETLCSGPAICREVVAGLHQGALSELVASSLQSSSPRAAIDSIWGAWLAGDSFARAAMDAVLDRLAWGVGLVVNLFDPDVIIAGGYVLKDHDGWIEEVQRRSQRWILHAGRRQTQIISSQVSIEDELRALVSSLHGQTICDETTSAKPRAVKHTRTTFRRRSVKV